MILAFFIQLAWSISIIGLGSFVLGKLLPKYSDRIPPEQCLIGGCFAIVLFIQIYHLFLKIDPVFSAVLFVLGLFCFCKDGFLRKDHFLYISLAIVSLRIAPHIIGPMKDYDSGLYHIQSILWHLEGPLVQGLANIQTRFGFNSNFSLLAGVLFPFKDIPQGFPLLNGILGNIVLLPLFRCLYEIGKKRKISVSSMYLLIPSIYVIKKLYHFSNSAATDLPVLILAIASFYFLLQYMEQGELGHLIVFSLAIALGVTIKLNLAPYGLFVLFFTIKHYINCKTDQKPLLWLYSCMILLGAFWFYRTYVMSGCWVFPLAATCTASEEYWAVSIGKVVSTYDWIKSWARIPGLNPSNEIFDNFGWFSLWFEKNVYLKHTALVFFSVISFAYLAARSIYRDVSLRVFVAIHFLAVSYWFLTAPDIRFGTFYFMIISAHAVSDLVGNVFRAEMIQRFFVVAGGVIVIIFGGLSHLHVFFKRDIFYLRKNFSDVTTVDYFETNGVAFKHPEKERDQCWAAPVPCTTRNEGSFYVKKKNGVITLISKRLPTNENKEDL